MKKFLETILAKMAGMDATTVTSLLNDDGTLKDETVATTIILNAHAAKIKQLSDDHTAEVTELQTKIPARVKAEVMEELEEKIKTTFGLKSDKRGLELVKALVSDKTKSGAKNEMTEAEILLHPAVIALTDAHAKEISKIKTEAEENLSKKDQEYEMKDVLSLSDKRISELLEEVGVVLPDNSTPEGKAQRENQIRLFKLDILNNTKIKKVVVDDKDQLIPLDKDGKPLTDAHGAKIGFDALVTEKAKSTWAVKKAEDRDAPDPAKKKEGAAGGDKKYTQIVGGTPKDKASYIDGLEKIRSSSLVAEEKTAAQLEFVTDFKDLA